jgi:hypothetical protein
MLCYTNKQNPHLPFFKDGTVFGIIPVLFLVSPREDLSTSIYKLADSHWMFPWKLNEILFSANKKQQTKEASAMWSFLQYCK